jgi:ATP synthase protein I
MCFLELPRGEIDDDPRELPWTRRARSRLMGPRVSRELEESRQEGAVDLRPARQLARRFVLAQAAVTAVVALVSFVLAGGHAAVSAALGGGISTAASLAMALVALGRLAHGGAVRVVGAFFLGEMLKFVVIVTLFVIVLRTTAVSPGAFFAAYVGTFLVYWIALARAALSGGKLGLPGER